MDIRPEDLTEVIRLSRKRYDFIIIDLPHAFDPLTVSAMDQADDILLLLTLDIPGIRGAKRALKVFDRLGYPRKKVRVVINRWSKSVDMELRRVEGHLGESIVGHIPNDYQRVIGSINLGQPPVQLERSSTFAKEINYKDQQFNLSDKRRQASLAMRAQLSVSGHERLSGLAGARLREAPGASSHPPA